MTIDTGTHSDVADQVKVTTPEGGIVRSVWDKTKGVRVTRIFYGSQYVDTYFDNTHAGSTTTGAWQVEVWK